MCIPSKSCSQHKSFSKDDKAVANEFNQFFSNVGQNANKSIQSLIFFFVQQGIHLVPYKCSLAMQQNSYC